MPPLAARKASMAVANPTTVSTMRETARFLGLAIQGMMESASRADSEIG